MALIVIVPLVLSFGKPKSKYVTDKDLIGIWIPAEEQNCFKKSTTRPDSTFCIELLENGNLFICQEYRIACAYGVYSSGWEEFSGTWCRLNDSVIQTPRFYWGEWFSEQIVIQRKSRNKISIKPAPAKVKIMGKTFTVE